MLFKGVIVAHSLGYQTKLQDLLLCMTAHYFFCFNIFRYIKLES